jgi:hypothetical protein
MKRQTFTLLAGSLALLGCTTAAEYEGSVAENSSPVINGTPVTADGIGTPWLSTSCSSTLIHSRAVLTAGHCLNAEVKVTPPVGTPIDPSTITVTTQYGKTSSGAQSYFHPLYDAAILTLASELPLPSSASIMPTFYPGADADLVGQAVYCQGWGATTFTTGGGLNSAILGVSKTESGGYQLVPNASGQILWKGDSGGSCFILAPGGAPLITGVMSTGHFDGTVGVAGGTVKSNHQVGSEDIRDWVNATLSIGIAALPTATSVSPSRGGVGTVVTIQGTNLTNASIFLDTGTSNSSALQGTSCSSTKCTFTAPALPSIGAATMTVDLIVNGVAVTAGTFTYTPKPACTYSFENDISQGKCGGALSVSCPATLNAQLNHTPTDAVTVYEAPSIASPWTPLWNVDYTSRYMPHVSEPTGSLVNLMACTGGDPAKGIFGDCDLPAAVRVTQYPCCVPLQCTPNAGSLCGHAPDGCGGFIDCGTCPSGSTCQSNNYCSTVCTSPECKCAAGGGTWNSDSNICVHCTTKACQCAQSGGSWNGHSCE